MAKKTITIEYTWEEIMALIEKDAIEGPDGKMVDIG